MSTNPYDAFSDPVDAAQAAAPPPVSPEASSPYDAFSEPAGASAAAPAIPPSPARRVMAPNEFEFEVEQALRGGAAPDAVRQQFRDVIDARTGGPINFPRPEELDAAAAYFRSGGREPLQWNREILGPDGTPSSDMGSYARGIADRVTLNFADELEAFVETGSFSGDEFDQALTRRQQRRMADDPDFRAAGQFVGMGLQSALPAGAASRVAGMGRQMAMGAGVGGGLFAMEGIGAGSGDTRFSNVGEDFAMGAGFGLAAPVAAGVGRKLVQTFVPGGAVDQTLSNDILQSAGLSADELRQRAADFFAATGRGARISDLLTPDEAQRFTRPLSRSDAARDRVLGEVETARTELPASMTNRIVTDPNPTPNALTPVSGAGPVPGTRPIIGPEEIRRQAGERAAREYGAVEAVEIPIDPATQLWLERVIPYASVKKLDKDLILDALRRGKPLTVAQLDVVQKGLGKAGQGAIPGDAAFPGGTYSQLQEDLVDFVSERVPGYGAARENFARRMTVADGGDPRFLGGAELGRAAVGNTPTSDALDAIARQTPEGRAGVALGARSGVYNEALESPGKSYALARRLEQDQGFQERLRASLPPGEADDLIDFATAQKQAIDSVAAMARIPQDKIETLLDSTEEMTDAIVAAGLGAGGAFKAGIINSILARTNIGEGAANRLADDLLNPARRERVIELLERAGLPKMGVREIVQGAFIAAGAQLATANREPEGVPMPTETVTMGVPQQ